MISVVEKDYITKGVHKDIRADGRSRNDHRVVALETGIIPQSSGSCRVTVDGTDVLVGIKVEIGPIELAEEEEEEADGADTSNAQRRNRGRVVCSVECSPSSIKNVDARDVETMCNEYGELMNRVFNGDHGGIDLKALCIIPGSTCWILYIDALVLDYAGNLLDAIFFASWGAIQNTLIPKVSLEESMGHYEFEVADAETETLAGKDDVPVAVTLYKIGRRHVMDPTLLEELCSDARLTVAVNRKGNVCCVQKGGGGAIEPSLLAEMIHEGRRVGSQQLKTLVNLLNQKNKQGFI
ncbi:Exosome complex component RRP42 [Irineochytrium annulatum]|nr:Exosome complex component RRP42 [Irineochytrium annulatum]